MLIINHLQFSKIYQNHRFPIIANWRSLQKSISLV